MNGLELTVLMLLGLEAGQTSVGMPRKPGESQGSFLWVASSVYKQEQVETLACGGLAPHPLLGLQERVLLSNPSKEKVHLSLSPRPRAGWALPSGLAPLGCRHQEPVI